MELLYYIIAVPFGFWFILCWFIGINEMCMWIEKYNRDLMVLPYFTMGLFGPFVIMTLITKDPIYIYIGLPIQFLVGVIPGSKHFMSIIDELKAKI